MQRLFKRVSTKQRPLNFSLDYSHPLAKGLVFAGLGNTPRGMSYRDSSLYGNHSTLTNMEPATDWVWSQELGRWVLDFDGSDDILQVPHSRSLSLLTGCSISLWFKSSGFVGDDGLLVLKSFSAFDTSSKTYELAWLNDSLYFQLGDGTAPTVSIFASAPGYDDNKYHHVLARWQYGSVQLYLDGTLKASGAGTEITEIQQNTDAVKIGKASLYPFYGTIGDVLIWNTYVNVNPLILANRSDPMLGGLILPPRRKLWAVPAAATGNRRRRVIIAGTNR